MSYSQYQTFSLGGYDERCAFWSSSHQPVDRKWSFPSFSRFLENRTPLRDPVRTRCVYGIITWENCSTSSPMDNTNHEHMGVCVIKQLVRCDDDRYQQLGPRACCSEKEFKVLEKRKRFCFGENCPELVKYTPLALPVVDYEIGFYHPPQEHGQEKSRVRILNTYCLEPMEKTGKDPHFDYKNADGPGYESFETDIKTFRGGVDKRMPHTRGIMSHIP
ncbi:hypothetical protein MFRU_010g02930 [Monilinia fructicola]|nr:hypothetical protein MFRU_010g02930 [Monilinia fructicola]